MRQSDLFLNPAILVRLRDVTGTDIVAYRMDGSVASSTLDETAHSGLLARLRPDSTVEASALADIVVRQDTCDGVPCFVAYTHMQGAPPTIVELVDTASELRDATGAITRIVLLTAADRKSTPLNSSHT